LFLVRILWIFSETIHPANLLNGEKKTSLLRQLCHATAI